MLLLCSGFAVDCEIQCTLTPAGLWESTGQLMGIEKVTAEESSSQQLEKYFNSNLPSFLKASRVTCAKCVTGHELRALVSWQMENA